MAQEQASELEVAMATWLVLLHTAGVEASHGGVRSACEAVSSAEDEQSGDARGMDLVEVVRSLLNGTESANGVLAVAQECLGDRVGSALGEGDRSERVHRIRKYQFGRSLPWLARIWERTPNGDVAPSWLLIEQVTDQVLAMDPNPWNDIDEERTMPVGDFQVLWELDGCPSVHIL